MPNWCENQLVVRGEPDEVRKMVEFVKGENGDFDFNTIIPYPAHFKEQDAKVEKMRAEGVNWNDIPSDGYNSGGYDWCCENWGTKWNANVLDVDVYGGVASYFIDTAWSPPLPVIHELSKKFPTLYFEITFGEPGMDFSGVYGYLDGNCMREDNGDYQEYGQYDYEEEEEEDEEEEPSS